MLIAAGVEDFGGGGTDGARNATGGESAVGRVEGARWLGCGGLARFVAFDFTRGLSRGGVAALAATGGFADADGLCVLQRAGVATGPLVVGVIGGAAPLHGASRPSSGQEVKVRSTNREDVWRDNQKLVDVFRCIVEHDDKC